MTDILIDAARERRSVAGRIWRASIMYSSPIRIWITSPACHSFWYSVGDMRAKPLTMHATLETQEIIRAHIFNWKNMAGLQPDPDPGTAFFTFQDHLGRHPDHPRRPQH